MSGYVYICKNDSRVKINRKKKICQGFAVYYGKYADENEEKDVAIKHVTDENSEREIDLMKKLPIHENVIRLINDFEADSESVDPGYYIVMELGQEKNLFEKLSGGGFSYSWEYKKTILLNIGHGLSHLHDNGIVHRDLKPHNIVFSLDGLYAKICDFGLAKDISASEESKQKSMFVIGTHGWGSPESYIGKVMSEESDIFSAGLVFFYVISDGEHVCGPDIAKWTEKIKELGTGEKQLKLEELCENKEFKTENSLAKHLISHMLQQKMDQRPTAEEVLMHPLFWSDDFRLQFIHDLYESCSDLLKEGNYPSTIDLSCDWVTTHLQPTDSNKTNSVIHKLNLYERAVELKKNHTDIMAFAKLIHSCVEEIEKDTEKDTENKEDTCKSKEALWEFFTKRLDAPVHLLEWWWKGFPSERKEDLSRFLAVAENRPLVQKPSAPENLTARLEGKIVITWTLSNKTSITKYKVYVTVDENAKKESVPTAVEALKDHFELEKPLPGKLYTFWVTAIDGDIESEQSEKKKILTNPSPVSCLACKYDASSHKFVISWKRPDDEISEYRIQPFINDEKTEGGPIKCAKTSLEWDPPKDAANSNLYHFDVWAESPFGKTGDKRTTEKVSLPPDEVDGIDVKKKSQSFALTWNKSNGSASYEVRLESKKKKEMKCITRDTSHEFTVSLDPEEEYWFSVTPINIHGSKGKVCISRPYKIIPPKIGEIDITIDSNVVISWPKMSDDIDTYQGKIFVKNLEGKDEDIERFVTVERSYSTRSVPSKQYQAEVVAVCNGNFGQESISKSVTSKPSQVTDLILRPVEECANRKKLVAKWRALAGHNYKIVTFCNGKRINNEPEMVKGAKYEFEAEEGKWYFVKVTAVISEKLEGDAAKSNTTMLGPEKVEILRTSCCENRATITWKAAEGALNYVVSLENLMTKKIIHDESTNELELVLDIEPCTLYKLMIYAQNQFNVSGSQTEDYFLSPPGNVTISVKGTLVSVSWDEAWDKRVKYRVIVYDAEATGSGYISSKTLNKNKYSETMNYSTKYRLDVAAIIMETQSFVHEGSSKTLAESANNEMTSDPVSHEICTGPRQLQIKGISLNNNIAQMEWEPLDERDVTYIVTIYSNDDPPYDKFVKETSMKHNLEPGNKYRFEIVAMNRYQIKGEKTTTPHEISIVAAQAPEQESWSNERDVMEASEQEELIIAVEAPSDQRERTYEPTCWDILRSWFQHRPRRQRYQQGP